MLILKQTVFSLAVVIMSIVTSSTSVAQDDASANLQRALEKIDAAVLHMSGSFKITKTKVDGKSAVVSIVMGAGQSGKDLFTGELDVYRGDSGVVAAASPENLEQVKIMYDGQRSLYSQRHWSASSRLGKDYDLPALRDLIRSTLDVEGLVSEVAGATRVRVTEKEGVKSYRFTVDGEFFDAEDDSVSAANPEQRMISRAMKQMVPKVLEGVVTVDVDPSDTPTRIKYALQYNDPMKEMMGGGAGEARIVIDGSGGNRDPVLGNMVIVDYRVLPDSEGPAKQFADEMAERLKAASK